MKSEFISKICIKQTFSLIGDGDGILSRNIGGVVPVFNIAASPNPYNKHLLYGLQIQLPRYKMIRRDNTVHINNASQRTKNNKRDPYVHKMASKLLFLIFLHYLPDRFSLTNKTSSRRSVFVFNL